MATTRSRVAGEGYSWLQAVHWVAGSGLYTPGRSHGPKFSTTTVHLAQRLAQLSPCRPGIAYLARQLKTSERTVQYHLQMLREAGLLAYRMRGSRRRGQTPLASEFALVIPPAFDQALGIRTTGNGTARRACGIAAAGQKLIARLGRKARTKQRRRPRRGRSVTGNSRPGHAVSAPGRPSAGTPFCTPMQDGCSGSSPTGTTPSPSEGKLARGKKSPHHSEALTGTGRRTRVPAQRRTLNTVGRRFQLARELTGQAGWLTRASVPRIAWIIRHVSDAGWTVTDVQAWLHARGEPAHTVHRPSGMLATLLASAHRIWDTPAKRTAGVEAWQDSQQAARIRHTEWDGTWTPPRSMTVQHQVQAALRELFTPPTPHIPVQHRETQGHFADTPDPASTALCEAGEVDQLQQTAWNSYLTGDTALVTTAIDILGPAQAEEIYGTSLVARVQRLTNSTPTKHTHRHNPLKERELSR